MARRDLGFDPVDLNATIEQVKEGKKKLGHFQENWGLYIPLVMGIATIAGLYAGRTKNRKFKEWYARNYPLLNGLTMMVPAYFSWKTIQYRKLEKQIAEEQTGVLGNFETLESLMSNPWVDKDYYIAEYNRPSNYGNWEKPYMYKHTGEKKLTKVDKKKLTKLIDEIKNEKMPALSMMKKTYLEEIEELEISKRAGWPVKRSRKMIPYEAPNYFSEMKKVYSKERPK